MTNDEIARLRELASPRFAPGLIALRRETVEHLLALAESHERLLAAAEEAYLTFCRQYHTGQAVGVLVRLRAAIEAAPKGDTE